MGLDCATSAKDILSRDICESITKELRDKRATPTLCESLLETVRLALNQCLARTNERIKELAQDHMIIMGTHDHQRLAIEANPLHERVLQGARVSDIVRTVANEVHANFNISSGDYIDGCIRIILRQFMHQLPLQLSSELLGALKLSEPDLSERSRMWVE
jgi:cytochrome P450